MAHESFEDDEVADVLNKHFISIKVDREERPDIDSIYMNFCQAMTGSGGWPLTIVMTPEKKPFFAGTYFSKNNKHGRIGIIDLLIQIDYKWKNEKDKLINSSGEILEFIKKNVVSREKSTLDIEDVDESVKSFKDIFDPIYGGFGNYPKFPTPHNLNLLLRYFKLKNDKKSLDIVEKTLKSMYKGGMFDHIGYGFARYSVDKKWLVPHFEKMLYDNALLANVYIEVYLITKEPLYRSVAEKIFEFVEREMTSSNGGFYSAIDADSEGVEGKFYVFDYNEIIDVLGEENGKIFSCYYDITKEGNFESRNIPNLIKSNLKNIENDDKLKNLLEKSLEKLYKYRNKKTYPHKDDKILTAWNGLMINALALGGRVFKNDVYINRAEKCVDFILNNLINTEGRLLARYRDGEVKYKGYLDDYAFLISGILELYRSTFKFKYLKIAKKLNEDMLDLFWDNKDCALFIYGNDSEELLIKHKEAHDGAMPSGNSVASLNLIKLSKILEDSELEKKSKEIIKTFGGEVKKTPIGYSYLLMSLLFNMDFTTEVVILGDRNDMLAKDMIDALDEEFNPFTTVIIGYDDIEMEEILPRLKSYSKLEGKTTALICKNFSCNEPVADLKSFKKILNK